MSKCLQLAADMWANEARKVKSVQRVVGIILIAMLISASAAPPAHASGEDAAGRVVCEATYYFYSSYYLAHCA
jgi:hypothetical protein